MIWLILGILTLGSLLYLCAPLYGAREPEIVLEDVDAYRAEISAASSEQSVNLERQLIARAGGKPLRTGVPRAWLLSVFIGTALAAPLLYGWLGTPDMARAQNTAPLTQPPNAAQIEALSPEDRSAMITAMVEGLAQRLKDDPEDVEGWVRLLRSRLVLGQEELALEELKVMRETFGDRPAVIGEILVRSGWVTPAPNSAQEKKD